MSPAQAHPVHITRHAKVQAARKGWSPKAVFLAACDPDVTYPSGPAHPGQERRIRGDLVAVVDRATETVITVYLNITRTALRPDQAQEARA